MLPQASAEYYREQQKIMGVVLLTAKRIWGDRPPRDFDFWFDEHVDQFVALAEAGQRRAIAGTDEYVAAVLTELGTPVDPDVEIDQSPLIGIASDGRELDSLMYGAVIATKAKIAEADTVTSQVITEAWSSGLSSLLRRFQLQVADAARVATSLHMTARNGVGYVRMLNPPSCKRCVVLAGKFYRYNQGFDRHPGCDCRHIPARENVARDLRTDPLEYFNSRTYEEQDKEFTYAGAEAIRDGAEITQVVNARRGMSTTQSNLRGWIPKGRLSTENVYGQDIATTNEGITRRGVAYQAMSEAGYAKRSTDVRGRKYFQAKAPRLMPESIYEIADGRADALRLLKLYGYIVD